MKAEAEEVDYDEEDAECPICFDGNADGPDQVVSSD